MTRQGLASQGTKRGDGKWPTCVLDHVCLTCFPFLSVSSYKIFLIVDPSSFMFVPLPGKRFIWLILGLTRSPHVKPHPPTGHKANFGHAVPCSSSSCTLRAVSLGLKLGLPLTLSLATDLTFLCLSFLIFTSQAVKPPSKESCED